MVGATGQFLGNIRLLIMEPDLIRYTHTITTSIGIHTTGIIIGIAVITGTEGIIGTEITTIGINAVRSIPKSPTLNRSVRVNICEWSRRRAQLISCSRCERY